MYYNGDWKTNSNILQTKATTAVKRKSVLQQIYDPKRTKMVPLVPQTSMQLHDAPRGMLPLPAELEPTTPIPSSPPTVSGTGLTSASSATAIAATVFVAGSSRAADPVPEVLPNHIQLLAKRKVSQVVLDTEASRQPKKPRQTRTCRKCGRASPKVAGVAGCRGAKEVQYCTNTCRDCGQSACRGRNPKKPDVVCQKTEWD